MASYVTPKKNTQFIFYIGLVQQADTRLLKANPTLAAADFNVSIDGGALAALGTTPTVTPAAGRMVKVTLSTSEMNGDNITVVCSDNAGAEWCDQIINIQTSARQIDDLAYPATSGRSMVVDAAGLVDANTVKVGATGAGTAQTARDLGASVLISSGTGTGQLDVTSGSVKATLSNGVTHGGSTAIVTMKTLTVDPGSGNGDAVIVNGGAASGATPAGHGIKVTGGAASTTGGGTSAEAIQCIGGAGAASTNGASAGIVSTGGGTTPVTGGVGIVATGR